MTQKKRQNLTKQCDALFSKIVRSRGACEACGQTWDLQCAHGFSRRYRAVRWNEANAFALCRGCHLKYTVRPLEWEEWMRERIGGNAYDELRHAALYGENPDLKETAAALRDRWERLEGVA